jgi:RNase P/RNase MRP subunit POP5
MSRRYILVKIISDKPLSRDQFGSALADSVRGNFGEIGICRIEPKVVRYDATRSRAIVACRASAVDELQAAVTLISQVAGASVALLVIGVSGTIRALARRQPR